MQSATFRFLSAAAWPLTVWTSLGRFNDHAADDYVERTFPIVASAVAFWLGAVALGIFAQPVVTHIITEVAGEEFNGVIRHTPSSIVGVLWLFVPVIYLVGFWLFSSREEAFEVSRR
jgi:hypothetical protein